MESWDLSTLDVKPRKPEVVDSNGEGRAIVINLPSGERLEEHQVHERAWVLVISGKIRVDLQTAESTGGGPGFLAVFDPSERHAISAEEDTRILLLLAPWPGDGHPSLRTDAG